MGNPNKEYLRCICWVPAGRRPSISNEINGIISAKSVGCLNRLAGANCEHCFPVSVFSDIKFVVWNQPRGEYLHHRSWQGLLLVIVLESFITNILLDSVVRESFVRECHFCQDMRMKSQSFTGKL